MDAGRLKHGGAANVVFVKRIAAIDDGVARFQQFGKGKDRFLGRRAGGQHDPDSSRGAEFLHHFGERSRAGRAFLGQGVDGFRVTIINDALMSAVG